MSATDLFYKDKIVGYRGNIKIMKRCYYKAEKCPNCGHRIKVIFLRSEVLKENE